jgi:hypothetical protein
LKTLLCITSILTIASADTLWLRRYDGGLDEIATGVACDNGQVVVGASQVDSVDYDYDWLVLWYGQDGSFRRSAAFEWGADDYVLDAELAPGGAALLAGLSYTGDRRPRLLDLNSRPQGVDEDIDGILLKLDTAGVARWYARIPWVELRGVVADHRGGGAVSGTQFNGVDFDLFCAQFGAGGESLWARTLDFGAFDVGYRVARYGSRGFVQAGTVMSDTSAYCLAVLYDSLGETLWTRRYQRHQSDYGIGAAVDEFGGCYIAGAAVTDTTIEALLLKYSGSGELLWERMLVLDPPQSQWVSASADNGGIVVAGTAYGDAIGNDFLVARYNIEGETLWIARWNETDDDIGQDVDSDEQSNPVVTGVSLDQNWYYDCATVKYAHGVGVAEARLPVVARPQPNSTVVRGVLHLATDVTGRSPDIFLLDATGCRVLNLKPGENSVSHVAPGVYFVRAAGFRTGRVTIVR